MPTLNPILPAPDDWRSMGDNPPPPEAMAFGAEARRSRMSEEGALLDRVLSAVERVANEIPAPSRQAAELFNIVVAARAFHSEALSKERRDV